MWILPLSLIVIPACIGRSLTGFSDSLPKESEIKEIPHFGGSLPSRMFSGYLNVTGSTKRLFYVLVLSHQNPEEDPLVFWTNGGPGCSSMGAFFEENGPFKTATEGLGPSPALLLKNVSLEENEYSWSKVANVLYFDMPAGTGLSYATDKEEYKTNDTQAAEDTYNALQTWFTQFARFKDNAFYLSGESYSGIYVPLIASLIVDGNKQRQKSDTPKGQQINLKGYILGNPTTDYESKDYRLAELYEGLSLISEDLLKDLERLGCPLKGPTNKVDCRVLQREVKDRVDPTFNFDVLVNCFYGMQTYNRILYDEMKAKLAQKGIHYKDPIYGGYEDHCDYDDRASGFLLNDEATREALHAAAFADSTQTLAGFFEMCQERINYTRVVNSTIPIHHANIKAGLSVFIYSGDHDRVIPTHGTHKWTAALGKQLGGQTADYEPWWREAPQYFGYQIGGYVSLWDNLAFATIRGAGHQVPTHKPAEILELLTHFLTGDLQNLTVRPDRIVSLPSSILEAA